MVHDSDMLRKRTYAMTTDLFIIVVTNYFFMASFTQFLRTVFFHFPLRTQLFFVEKMAMLTPVSFVSLYFAYFSIFYFATNGRTLGKTLFGIKVVSKSGELSINQSMIRSFTSLFCSMTGSVLFIVSYMRKDEASLADLFSGSTVDYDKLESVVEANSGTEFQLTLLEAVVDQNENEKAA